MEEVHKKVAEDAKVSYGLKPRCELGGELKKKPYISHITDSFPITELLGLLQTYTAGAKKVKPNLVY